MGSQESIVRAVVAQVVTARQRARAYGVFNTGFGLCWFGGSALLGLLYDYSRPALNAFSVTVQLAALPVLAGVARRLRHG
jgi:predicted MFS family arabinose efflux permease